MEREFYKLIENGGAARCLSNEVVLVLCLTCVCVCRLRMKYCDTEDKPEGEQ